MFTQCLPTPGIASGLSKYRLNEQLDTRQENEVPRRKGRVGLRKDSVELKRSAGIPNAPIVSKAGRVKTVQTLILLRPKPPEHAILPMALLSSATWPVLSELELPRPEDAKCNHLQLY